MNISTDTLQELPRYKYNGEIIVIDDKNTVANAVIRLSRNSILGFDTETKPSFKKGEYHEVSLLQLACDECVYLFRLNMCGFPEVLRNLLSDKTIHKIGVGIRDDLKALNKLKPFKPQGFVDLQDLASKYGIEDKSFAKLMAIIFKVKISKGQQTSNWEKTILTEAQLCYAATDAWGALMMYKELKAHWAELSAPVAKQQ